MLQLARRLYQRRASGIVLPYRMLDPDHSEGQCHQNAGKWARDNPGWKLIHGWLVFDYEKTSRGIIPQVSFNPHSVVEDEGGARIDPTPSRASQRYPFLEHEGAPADFIEIVQGHSLIRIDYNTLSNEVSLASIG
jgi:hypothetical protein